MKKRFLLPALLLLLLCCALAVSAHADPLLVEVTADRTEVKAGEPATAAYTVSGGSGDYYIDLLALQLPDGGSSQSRYNIEDSVENPDLPASGSFSFVLDVGGTLRLAVHVRDSEGREMTAATKDIRVTDDREVEPLRIEFSPVNADAEPGTPVTATWSVSGGSGEYAWVLLDCIAKISGGADEIHIPIRNYDEETDGSVPAEGTVSFTPVSGGEYRFQVSVCDTDARITYGFSDTFTVPDDGTTEPLDVKVSLDTETLKAGETVTASYSVSGGSGKYDHIELNWRQQVSGSVEFTLAKTDDLLTLPGMGPEGTYSFTPALDGILFFEIYAQDTDGRAVSVISDPVTVSAP